MNAMSIKPTTKFSSGVTARLRNRSRNTNARRMNRHAIQNQRTTATIQDAPSIPGTNTLRDVTHNPSPTMGVSGSVRMPPLRATVTSRARLLYYLQEALDIVDDTTGNFDNENQSN